ncbi:unnamed protein product [Angiostrongylus costaricensis]|uniref:Transposase n=1 Tax=Angiostrongylus costaricensis TaxID=334426 RepID=A0A0R3PKT3_ANGCS|nr:unnamed protein product [Angiostrongylus costaricensis]
MCCLVGFDDESGHQLTALEFAHHPCGSVGAAKRRASVGRIVGRDDGPKPVPRQQRSIAYSDVSGESSGAVGAEPVF